MRYFLGEEGNTSINNSQQQVDYWIQRFGDTSLFYHRATFHIPEARLEFNFERIQEGKSLNRSDRSFQELPSSNRRRSSSLRSAPNFGAKFHRIILPKNHHFVRVKSKHGVVTKLAHVAPIARRWSTRCWFHHERWCSTIRSNSSSKWNYIQHRNPREESEWNDSWL